METVKRKSGLRYREMLCHNGHYIKSPYYKRKTDAQIWKRNKLTNLEQLSLYGIDHKKGDTLFSDYAQKFLQKKLGSCRSPSSYQNYESRLRLHILPVVGNLLLKQIRKSHAEELQLMLKATHNNKGVNLIVSTFKAIMLEAERDEYIITSPFKNLKHLSESQATDRFWSKEEINQFLRSSQADSNYCIYFLAIHTGMRKGELIGLRWSAINLQQRMIHVRATSDRFGQRESTKSGKNRSVPMNDHLFHFLFNLSQHKNSDFVFSDANNQPLNAHHLYRDFAKAQVNAKMHNMLRFHDLRHTFASNFVMNGGSIFELQKILGHSKIEMTMRYTHHSPEYLATSSQYMNFGLEDLVMPKKFNPILTSAVNSEVLPSEENKLCI